MRINKRGAPLSFSIETTGEGEFSSSFAVSPTVVIIPDLPEPLSWWKRVLAYVLRIRLHLFGF
jgi:hypothetical protein